MEENKENVPKIRFPGFEEPWEQRELRDVICDMYNGQTPSRFNEDNWKGNINWLTSGELNRGVVEKTVEKITIQGQKDANLRIVPKGTFVIAITGLEASGTRGNCAILGIDTTLNQSCMALFTKSEIIDSKFLFQWYRKIGEKYGISYTQGTKQQSYNAEIIKILPINLPSVKEQIKIYEYLFKLDNLITLHQRKLEHLQDKKKGLLQKIFPKEGEKFPELRFPGFTAPWEQRKLKQLASFAKGQGYSKNDLTDAGTPIILYGRLYTKYQSVISEVDTFVIPQSGSVYSTGKEVIVPASGETAEDIARGSAIAKPGFLLGGDLNIIYPNKDISTVFLALSISNGKQQKELSKKAQGKSVVHLHNSDLEDVTISYPCIEEQDRIGSVFASVDNLVTLHQRKLERLKQQKKGLLQQMFI